MSRKIRTSPTGQTTPLSREDHLRQADEWLAKARATTDPNMAACYYGYQRAHLLRAERAAK